MSHGDLNISEELMRFRENTNYPNVRILFSIEMLNEGIHIDGITGVILLRPTLSPIIHFQQIGRALQAGNTNEPLIFDFVNNKASIHSGDISGEYKKSKVSEIVRREALNEKNLYIPEFNIIDETQDVLAMFSALEDELTDNFDANFEALKAYVEKEMKYTKEQIEAMTTEQLKRAIATDVMGLSRQMHSRMEMQSGHTMKIDNKPDNLEWVTHRENMEHSRQCGFHSGVGRSDGIRDTKGRFGKKDAGRLLDGREWNEFPEVN